SSEGGFSALCPPLVSPEHVNSSSLREGLAAFRLRDDAAAARHLRACLESADEPVGAHAACKTALGQMHLLGAGVSKSLSEALLLFQEAAAEGHAEAQFNLGLLHSAVHAGGDDLYRQEALAVLHLYAASTAGHPGALMAMGYRHQHGYGVPQACTTAALNYIELAGEVAEIYSAGIPTAVELVRLNVHPSEQGRVIGSAELSLLVQMANGGDLNVAHALGERWLLGADGFSQDFEKARHYLTRAAEGNHPGAKGLLGYMLCLGLGMPANLTEAHRHFVAAAQRGDKWGFNGLGYLSFSGRAREQNYSHAFRMFNESATRGSADGMFNLGSLYLTGTGTDQSFPRAVKLFTEALERGHTAAAYALAVMYLQGIGIERKCDAAVRLLKTVCERSRWVTDKLAEAKEIGEREVDRAALLFLKLAEAGHEVAQTNVAHMLDAGQSSLLFQGEEAPEGGGSTEAARRHGRVLAQRYYELSAAQGSVSSELRLGDYAYYGWGVSAFLAGEGDEADDGDDDGGLLPPDPSGEVRIAPQAVDYEASLARYRRTADMPVTRAWMQTFAARASFNLGFMHQFGLGVPQDLLTARMHYHRSRDAGDGAAGAPVAVMLLLLDAHALLLRLPTPQRLLGRLLQDLRVHALAVHLAAVAVLVWREKHLLHRHRDFPG
ncbi:unnamed protein product, partial [Prorocentrum cordatum]